MTEEAKPIVHNVVPFGKYRGQPIEVLRQDQDYLNWLAAQDWFRKQYAALYAMLVAEPTETPEHNKYQALFLNKRFAAAVFDTIYSGQTGKGPNLVAFETRVQLRDPTGRSYYSGKQSGTADVQLTASRMRGCLRIEIKPVMGDDYPAVLRQMQTSCCNVLYLVTYTGEGATLEEVKEIFRASDIDILLHNDFRVAQSQLLD